MKQTAVEWYWDKIKSHFEHDGDLYEVACMTYAIAKEKEKEQLLSFAKLYFVFSDEQIKQNTMLAISDDVLFEQATVAMEEIYGYGCETEIDAYFRGLKWMQKQFNKQD